MQRVKHYFLDTWEPDVDPKLQEECINDLEGGCVLGFDHLEFLLSDKEKSFFSPELLEEGSKNISYSLENDRLQGCGGDEEMRTCIHKMMKRFATSADRFVRLVLSFYQETLELGRTSFRPIEVAGRQAPSFRKDDTLLHVDAFPSTPTNGRRILRFFANVNLERKPRTWKVGESLENVLNRFLHKAKKPLPGQLSLMNKLGITKTRRSLYDHFMLQIHDEMKKDVLYQKEVDQEVVEFPSGSSWLVFTDQVSHAALAGQYVFEQSFYLPVEAQKFKERSPVALMEALLGERLLLAKPKNGFC